MTAITYERVQATLDEIFADLAEDLGAEDIALTPEVKIIDLGIESISLVYLVSELQQHFGLGNRLFDKLRGEQRLLKDMSVDDIVRSVVELGAQG